MILVVLLFVFQQIPTPATISRSLERTKIINTSPHNQNGGGSGGGSGGSNKQGNDNPNSRSQIVNSNQTKSDHFLFEYHDSPDKDKGIFIMDKMPYFKCAKNKDSADQLPKVMVDGKEVQICLKGSSKDRVCIINIYTFAHIFVLDKITDGVSKLNTWALDIDCVKWSSQKSQQRQQKQNQRF